MEIKNNNKNIIGQGKTRKRLIMRILQDNWARYRKLPLEDVRNDIKENLRIQLGNKNEQLSHAEFHEIVIEYMSIEKAKNDNQQGR